jgi:Ubiquitin-protein ligase
MISVLGILQPSPNKYFGVGESRNLNIFCCGDLCGDGISFTNTTISEEENMLKLHFSSLIPSKSENDRDLEDCLEFLGRLVSTAVRHGIPVDLDLPLGTVWKQLCEEDVSDEEILKEIDVIAYNRLRKSGISPIEDVSCFNLLTNQRKMFNAFAEGISSVLPIEIFSIFTGEELRDFFCGDNDVDVELLKKVAEYEGYNEDDAVIKNFWEVLREMTTDERKLFLQFVWARTRMPFKQSDFDAPFKIQKDTKSSSNNALPSASTCFFSLMLPEYDDKDTLRDKLLFAINNVKTMESDYVTNDAEVSEGWRDV